MDDVYGGEHLLAAVYAAIRNSPYWSSSLLIITYDEHGGLYDSVAPGAAPAPGDNPNYGYNRYGFDFTRFGVRVPAVVVSPLIPAGTVDHTQYDHSSVLKTVEQLFGLAPLTQRDAAASGVEHLLSLSTPRTDCPLSLNSPAPLMMAKKAPLTDEESAVRDMQPVPRTGNMVGTLQVMRKTEIEMSGGTPPERAAIQARFDAIQTRGQARDYIASVMERVGSARKAAKIAARTRP
jgi:phospholipase C